jgi:predicted amino acid racemase
VKEVMRLEGIKLAGIGTGLACLGGVVPDKRNMIQLSNIAQNIENTFEIKLEFVSCGNSSVYFWLNSTEDVGKINNVCLGESLLQEGKDRGIQKQ